MTNIINKLELILSKLFGLKEKKQIHLSSVEVSDNKILVFTNEPNKRHRIVTDWESFAKKDLQNLDQVTQSKLGIALGKAIASDLTITVQPALTILNKKDDHTFRY